MNLFTYSKNIYGNCICHHLIFKIPWLMVVYLTLYILWIRKFKTYNVKLKFFFFVKYEHQAILTLYKSHWIVVQHKIFRRAGIHIWYEYCMILNNCPCSKPHCCLELKKQHKNCFLVLLKFTFVGAEMKL